MCIYQFLIISFSKHLIIFSKNEFISFVINPTSVFPFDKAHITISKTDVISNNIIITVAKMNSYIGKKKILHNINFKKSNTKNSGNIIKNKKASKTAKHSLSSL